MVSQHAHLYAHHLSQCPSYSAAHQSIPPPYDEHSLSHLRRLFAREVKRNLFEAYLRPRETIINLVSTSISSSSAPGGEAFHFSHSPRGHYVLAYSSSRIHVLDVTGPELTVRRELKILRRPASTTITDDGTLLAVLSTDLQVDLYDLTGEHPKHTRAVALDYTPRTIALSPTGSVLAAAYDSGVEVSSLDPDCISTERRAVKCYAADSLSFSKDGTQLLGTTIQSRNPSTVVLTAPYYDPGGNLPDESISALWTTSILFPNGSRDCSHAVLLPSSSSDEASWTFTYDRVFETFRAVRIDDLRNGTTYFTGPTADSLSKLLPSTLPAASEAGDLVSAGFSGSIWLYGVPEDLEALPNSTISTVESEVSTPSTHPGHLGRRNSAPSLRSVNRPQSSTRTPQWQVLCDRARNTFIEGRKISSLDRVSAMTWVNDNSKSFHGERLVAVAPGVGGHAPENEDDGMNPVDGGRISVIDFDYSPSDGKKRVITIEVGAKEPDILEEEHRDLDTEVALVRRRTVAQRRGNRSNVARSATTVARPARPAVPPMPPMPNARNLDAMLDTPATPRLNLAAVPAEQSETVSIDEEQEVFDAPYSHTSPRSGTTLRRAATAAAVNRRLHPRAVAQDHIEYRRADGREEHPHESDADNWVPPPPPYTKDPVPPLPEHIQRSILAEAAAATLQRANTQRAPSLDFPGLDSPGLQRSRTMASASSVESRNRRDQFPFPRSRSDSTTRTIGAISMDEEPRRLVTNPGSPISPDFDDLYDVSPPGSPQPTPRRAPPTSVSPVPPIPPIQPMRSVKSESDTPSPPMRTPPSPLVEPDREDRTDTVSEPSPITESPPAPIHQIPRRPVGAGVSNSAGSPPTPTLAMRATIQQPVSPIPQPMADAMGRRLLDWENTTEANRVSPPTTRPRPSLSSQASSRTDHEETPLASDHQHLTEPPPNTLVSKRRQEEIESQPSPLARRSETAPSTRSHPSTREEPVPIWRRAGTAPAASVQGANELATTTSAPRMVMPSPDLLARLSSRSGRPVGLADPRRASGSFSQPRVVPGANRTSWGGPILHTPQHVPPEQVFRTPPTQAAAGTYGPFPTRSNTTYVPPSQQYASHTPSPPSRRISLNAPSHRHPPSSNSNLRPPMQRLDTIHSVNSAGEPSPWIVPQLTLGVGRKPSRAERSAAKNIKDAKKRGWRASMRKEEKANKMKWVDGSSSAGWTDVSSNNAKREMGQERKKKTSGKCNIM
jgi:hypothetical protein